MRSEAAAASEPKGDRFESARKRVQERTQGAGDKLDNALEHERGKSARLDELFQKAKTKIEKPRDDE